MYPFNLFKIHSHEVSFVFGSAGSCRGVYTHSDCDYGPSKVMPYMYLWVKSTVGLRQGRLISLPLEVHGFTLSALNTRVELPDRYAKHPKDAPLLENRRNSGVCATLAGQEILALDHRCPLGSICGQRPPFTPSQWA